MRKTNPALKLIDRIGNGLKAFAGISGSLPFSIAGFSANLRRKSVEGDPAGAYAGWVYAALSKRAKRIGAIELRLYQLDRAMNVEEIYDHDLLALLNRANPLQSRYQFFYTLEMMLGIWGSAPILKDRAGGKDIQYLWPLRPDMLKAFTDASGRIVSYQYRVGARVDSFKAEDVIVCNEPSPLSLAVGNSPLLAAGLEIDVDMQAALWNKYLIENFSEPGGVLTTDQAIDDKSFERLKKEWSQRHQGASNAGRWALLEKGLKAEPIGRSPKEMDMVESRRFHRNAITAILGVPMALMTSEDVNLANAEVAERVFARDTVDPQMRLIVSMLNEFLVPDYSDTLDLDYESPIPEDKQMQINLATAGEGRYLTVNEARDLFDYGPLDGGDAIFKPLGVYPQVGDTGGVNEPSATDPAAAPADPAKAVRKPYPVEGTKFEKISVAVKNTKEDRRKARVKARILARTHTKRKIISGIAAKVNAKVLEKVAGGESIKLAGIRIVDDAEKTVVHGDHRHTIKAVDDTSGLDPRLLAERIDFIKRLPREQKKYTTRFQGFFEQQQREVFANLKEFGLPKGRGSAAPSVKSVSKWVNQILFDQKKADDLIVAMAGDMYRDGITVGSAAIAKLLGIDPSNILATPFVVDFIQSRSFLMLAVNKTTQDSLRATLSEGVAQGEDLGQIRDRITGVYDEAQDFRAETIARTEVGASQNFGRVAEMQNQKVEKKVWIATFSNTRDAHAEADGQIVPADGSFTVGGESLEYPGDPAGSAWNTINCQCSVSPTLG